MLERQRAVLRHIFHGQEHPHFDTNSAAVDHHPQQLLWHSLNPQINDQQRRRRRSCSAASATDNSSLTTLKAHWQCNSSSAGKSKKRNAEFGLEEEGENEQIDVAEEQSDITTKAEMETSTNTSSKESLKASEVQKPDYIHVRARRGQATDSHSLAERARREKITKKMKCLQDLVPGCNKVTGKAGMLDEIINYVQSLQKQVEFLSMKLATVNPRLDFNIDNIFAKEIPAYIASLQSAAESTNQAYFQYNPMQSNYTVDVAAEQKAGSSSSVPNIPEVFLDPSCLSQLQQLSGWETDWQNLFSAGFQ